ncbi:hypothetical protein GUITHDRAFT_163752 [Guillardia theta CCMP2712]|uniref:Potassium channel domain-containing protein n=1 Tax=Guillardia theta (strain CCMP2712) TaxID=905079 RepID=L1J6U3_GUITC|nr:hypothetical protein GUITHDRAFT_163752 [Guillardia theta CCMP2712]EKX43780.1 hypothetical protein GUITHDRAFT_163752 [Guillardia theta CCMP2712]|eukprot:XP_005830760.1 hypothetical protein GUITHDRAFT_163752 [Guillardia theta CCMP2712]
MQTSERMSTLDDLEEMAQSPVSQNFGSRHNRRASVGRITLEDTAMARKALTTYSSFSSMDQLKRKGVLSGSQSPVAGKSPTTKRSRFEKIESEESKTEILSAAVAIYQVLYAPKGRLYNRNASEWAELRTKNLFWAYIWTLAGMVVAVWENEVLWSNDRTPDLHTFWLKVLIVVTTIIAMYFYREYYRAAIAQERLRGNPLHNGFVSYVNLQACGLYVQAVLDLLCLLPMPLPFLDFEFDVWNDSFEGSCTYQIDVFLMVVMFLRIRMFPRFYGECISGLASDIARAYGNVTKLVVGESFISKYLLTSNFNMVCMLWLLLILFYSYCLMLFERPMVFIDVPHSRLDRFANCVWCTVITMTTVGYGDVFPSTRFGRLIAMLSAISAMIMVAVSTNIVNVVLSQHRLEVMCLRAVEMLASRDDVKIKAAEVIQAVWRAYAGPERSSKRRKGRKVRDNDEVLLKVVAFTEASRAHITSKNDFNSDEVALLGQCMSISDRSLSSMDGVVEKLDSAIANLQKLDGC